MQALPGSVPWEVVHTERAADWIVALGEGDFRRGSWLPWRCWSSAGRGSAGRWSIGSFDPNRRAVILLGGDKRGDWTGWYERNVPLADDLYDAYLREET